MVFILECGDTTQYSTIYKKNTQNTERERKSGKANVEKSRFSFRHEIRTQAWKQFFGQPTDPVGQKSFFPDFFLDTVHDEIHKMHEIHIIRHLYRIHIANIKP